MTRYTFETVKRATGRFSWVLVAESDGRRCILARSVRDFHSKRQVRKAICAIKDRAPSADVLEATRSAIDWDLPAQRFEFAPYVLPLTVGGPTAPYPRTEPFPVSLIQVDVAEDDTSRGSPDSLGAECLVPRG